MGGRERRHCCGIVRVAWCGEQIDGLSMLSCDLFLDGSGESSLSPSCITSFLPSSSSLPPSLAPHLPPSHSSIGGFLSAKA
jgi:hypothetical protein